MSERGERGIPPWRRRRWKGAAAWIRTGLRGRAVAGDDVDRGLERVGGGEVEWPRGEGCFRLGDPTYQ